MASCCCCTEPDIPTVAGLLPADVPAISRGESHHMSRLRKDRFPNTECLHTAQPLLMGNTKGATVTASIIAFYFYFFKETVFVTACWPCLGQETFPPRLYHRCRFPSNCFSTDGFGLYMPLDVLSTVYTVYVEVWYCQCHFCGQK